MERRGDATDRDREAMCGPVAHPSSPCSRRSRRLTVEALRQSTLGVVAVCVTYFGAARSAWLVSLSDRTHSSSTFADRCVLGTSERS